MEHYGDPHTWWVQRGNNTGHAREELVSENRGVRGSIAPVTAAAGAPAAPAALASSRPCLITLFRAGPTST